MQVCIDGGKAFRKDEGGEMTPTPQWYDSPEKEQFATIKIELPRNWDSLMAELGYAPLKSLSVGLFE